MRRISTQGVWWRYTHVQPVPMKLDLLLPNYNALPFQDNMDSPPSKSHSDQLTSSSANSEYEILVPFDLSTDAPKIFANEMGLWGVIDRGVNVKIATIDEVTSVDDDGNRTLEIIQPIHNYHDGSHSSQCLEGNNVPMSGSPNGGYVPPIDTKYDLTLLDPHPFGDGKYFALPCNRATIDTFDAPLVTIGTQRNTSQYTVKEYGESAIQTLPIVDSNNKHTAGNHDYNSKSEDSMQDNITTFGEYFHGTIDPSTFITSPINNHVNYRDTFNKSALCKSKNIVFQVKDVKPHVPSNFVIGLSTYCARLNGPCQCNIASRGATTLGTLTGYVYTWLDISLIGPQLARLDYQYINNARCRRHIYRHRSLVSTIIISMLKTIFYRIRTILDVCVTRVLV